MLDDPVFAFFVYGLAMERYVLSWNKLLGLAILGTLGSALQIRLADSIALKTNQIESRCTFIQLTEKVELELDCGEARITESNPQVVLSYIRSPGSINCQLYRNAFNAISLNACRPRP